MTIAGAKALEVELFRLKDEERPRIVNEIASAREHGDLKENAEYHAAKDEQGFIEGRIQEIDPDIGVQRRLRSTCIRYVLGRLVG